MYIHNLHMHVRNMYIRMNIRTLETLTLIASFHQIIHYGDINVEKSSIMYVLMRRVEYASQVSLNQLI